jgi:hypothetical protein
MGLVSLLCVVSAAPQFAVDGAIVNAGTRVKMGGDGNISIIAGKRMKYLIGMQLVADGAPILPKELAESGLDVIKSKKTAVYTGTYTPKNGKPFGIEYSVALTSEDNARISLAFKTAAPVENIFSHAGLNIAILRDALAGESILIDGKELAIPSQRAGEKSVKIYNGEASAIVYFADDPARRLALTVRNAGTVSVSDVPVIGLEDANILLHLKPKNNEITFDVALSEMDAERSSGEVYANIDFWSPDKLKMPRYKLSKNLVQNSGFEDGFKYWTFGPLGVITEMRLGEHYSIDEGGYSGRRCLKILGEKGQSPAHIATFAIPVEPDTEYTISFHAKADRPGVWINSMPYTAVWGKFPGGKNYELSTEWKRYSNTFKVPNTILALDFGINDPSADCVAWIDAVQLRKALPGDYDKTPEDYEEKPYGVSFTSARRDNLFQPDDKTGAAFYVHGKALAKGTLGVRVTDFADLAVKEENIPFVVGEKGYVLLPALWADALETGLYIIESSIQCEDGFGDREFDRLAIMPSVKGQSVLHDKFFCTLAGSRWANWARGMERYQYLGINSIINFDPEYPAFREEMRKAGIFYFSSIFDGGERIGARGWDIRKDFALHQSAADLAVIEEAAYKKAKENPDICIWKTINEPGSGGVLNPVDNIEEMKKMVRCVAAARNGTLRANPKALVLTPDPANMYPTGGIKYIDTFLKAGGKDACDIVAIHPYRRRPESPDLDADSAALLSMLKNNGFTGDVWFTEGIYHQNYVIPALGLDTHQGCSSDHYRGGPLTYHMGWGERMALAYTMRSWLTGLKYADRVKLYVDWNFGGSSAFGIDMTVNAKAFAPNVLTRLLGNAVYKADANLGKEIRCYIFEDKEKRPVSALWIYNLVVDTEGKPCPEMDISLIPPGTEFIDCMGRTFARPDTNKLMISPLPTFLRGRPKTLAAFRSALEKTRVGSGEISPVDVFAQAVSSSHIDVSVRNLLSRTSDGRMKISDSETTVFDKRISIAGKDIWKYPLTVKKNAGALTTFVAKTEFTPSEWEKPIVNDITLDIIAAPKLVSLITIDGDLSDWPARAKVSLPARFMEFPPYGKDPAETMELKQKYPKGIPWKGNADLSAALYAAWDAENLYIAVKVKDDVFSPAATLDGSWTGDGIQLYFDCWGDARQQSFKGYDNNDQVFDLWPSPNGLVVKRAVAPEQQLAFLKTDIVANAKTAFKRVTGGYVYEVALPLRELTPINLRPESSFGFALIINDNDGDYRKRGLSLTPNGTEPHMRPDLYSVMALEN